MILDVFACRPHHVVRRPFDHLKRHIEKHRIAERGARKRRIGGRERGGRAVIRKMSGMVRSSHRSSSAQEEAGAGAGAGAAAAAGGMAAAEEKTQMDEEEEGDGEDVIFVDHRDAEQDEEVAAESLNSNRREEGEVEEYRDRCRSSSGDRSLGGEYVVEASWGGPSSPVFDEFDALDDNDDDCSDIPAAATAAAGGEGGLEGLGVIDEEVEAEAGNGGSSSVRGGTFDSPVERIEESSSDVEVGVEAEAMFETVSGPKQSTPVKQPVGSSSSSLIPDSMYLNPRLPRPASSFSHMSVSQQAALANLNQMLTGHSSLDTAVIAESTEEEFMSRIASLAESRGQSIEDASFWSIRDTLLPLVNGNAEKDNHSDSSDIISEVGTVEYENGEKTEKTEKTEKKQKTFGSSLQSIVPKALQRLIPRAKVTTENESDGWASMSEGSDASSQGLDDGYEGVEVSDEDEQGEDIAEMVGTGGESLHADENQANEGAAPEADDSDGKTASEIRGKHNFERRQEEEDESVCGSVKDDEEEERLQRVREVVLNLTTGGGPPMPKAKLTADDEGNSEDYDEEQENEEHDNEEEERGGEDENEVESKEDQSIIKGKKGKLPDDENSYVKIRAALSEKDENESLPPQEFRGVEEEEPHYSFATDRGTSSSPGLGSVMALAMERFSERVLSPRLLTDRFSVKKEPSEEESSSSQIRAAPSEIDEADSLPPTDINELEAEPSQSFVSNRGGSLEMGSVRAPPSSESDWDMQFESSPSPPGSKDEDTWTEVPAPASEPGTVDEARPAGVGTEAAGGKETDMAGRISRAMSLSSETGEVSDSRVRPVAKPSQDQDEDDAQVESTFLSLIDGSDVNSGSEDGGQNNEATNDGLTELAGTSIRVKGALKHHERNQVEGEGDRENVIDRFRREAKENDDEFTEDELNELAGAFTSENNKVEEQDQIEAQGEDDAFAEYSGLEVGNHDEGTEDVVKESGGKTMREKEVFKVEEPDRIEAQDEEEAVAEGSGREAGNDDEVTDDVPRESAGETMGEKGVSKAGEQDRIETEIEDEVVAEDFRQNSGSVNMVIEDVSKELAGENMDGKDALKIEEQGQLDAQDEDEGVAEHSWREAGNDDEVTEHVSKESAGETTRDKDARKGEEQDRVEAEVKDEVIAEDLKWEAGKGGEFTGEFSKESAGESMREKDALKVEEQDQIEAQDEGEAVAENFGREAGNDNEVTGDVPKELVGFALRPKDAPRVEEPDRVESEIEDEVFMKGQNASADYDENQVDTEDVDDDEDDDETGTESLRGEAENEGEGLKSCKVAGNAGREASGKGLLENYLDGTKLSVEQNSESGEATNREGAMVTPLKEEEGIEDEPVPVDLNIEEALREPNENNAEDLGTQDVETDYEGEEAVKNVPKVEGETDDEVASSAASRVDLDGEAGGKTENSLEVDGWSVVTDDWNSTQSKLPNSAEGKGGTEEDAAVTSKLEGGRNANGSIEGNERTGKGFEEGSRGLTESLDGTAGSEKEEAAPLNLDAGACGNAEESIEGDEQDGDGDDWGTVAGGKTRETLKDSSDVTAEEAAPSTLGEEAEELAEESIEGDRGNGGAYDWRGIQADNITNASENKDGGGMEDALRGYHDEEADEKSVESVRCNEQNGDADEWRRSIQGGETATAAENKDRFNKVAVPFYQNEEAGGKAEESLKRDSSDDGKLSGIEEMRKDEGTVAPILDEDAGEKAAENVEIFEQAAVFGKPLENREAAKGKEINSFSGNKGDGPKREATPSTLCGGTDGKEDEPDNGEELDEGEGDAEIGEDKISKLPLLWGKRTGEEVKSTSVYLDHDEDGTEEEQLQDPEEGDEVGKYPISLPALAGAVALSPGADVGPSLHVGSKPLPGPSTLVTGSCSQKQPLSRSSLSAAAAAATTASSDDPVELPSHCDMNGTVPFVSSGEASDGNEEPRQKFQALRVNFIRLALRLGQSAQSVIVAQVLYRLGLAEQMRAAQDASSQRGGGEFSFDRASAIAEELEATGGGDREELGFACTILMLGRTGVGKSATINSIFDDRKAATDAFNQTTRKVEVITGLVSGIKVRVIDTPGLLPSNADQRHNAKILASVKALIEGEPPDIVLYLDRLDMQSRDYGDIPLLRTITVTFGADIWCNAVVVLTHGSCSPPDGPNGRPLSHETFVTQKTHAVQQAIRQAAGDARLTSPVTLAENHSACKQNHAGERVLPNGKVWRPLLLLFCFASKFLADANSMLKLQDRPDGPFRGSQVRAPPLPFLLSQLLQSRAQLRLSNEQVSEGDESDEEEENGYSYDEQEYDQLPSFRRLAEEEIHGLDKETRRQYNEEVAKREGLFRKKLWKEEKNRRRESKKKHKEASAVGQFQFAACGGLNDDYDEEMAKAAAGSLHTADMELPFTFDSDNSSHRYRFLEADNSTWLVRPLLGASGWDHYHGFDSMTVEKMFVVRDKVPAAISGRITKDKRDASVDIECSASVRHGDRKVTLGGLELETIGDNIACTIRGETRFDNFKGNKTTGGLTLTVLADSVSAGMKIGDSLNIGKRLKVVVNAGTIRGHGDVAYGGSLEAAVRDEDSPFRRTLSSLGLTIMDWHGDMAVGGKLQSQFALGSTMMVGEANVNNRGTGQISMKASSSDHLQMALVGLLPMIRYIAKRLLGSESQ